MLWVLGATGAIFVVLMVLEWALQRKPSVPSSRFVPCYVCERTGIPTHLYRYEERKGRSRYTVSLCDRCARLKRARPVSEQE